MSSTTTAEITEVFSFTGGAMYGFTVYTDRKPAVRGGLTKGRKVGTLVSTTLPELLQDVAALIEQNDGTWEGLIKVLEKVPE